MGDAYGDALRSIFASYRAVKSDLKGKFDRDVRHPEVVCDALRKLSLFPDPNRTIRVTGSKGKGTVSRITAELLRQQRPGSLVGKVVSPEEFRHNDRIRINNEPISEQAFVEHYERVRPHLESSLERYGASYISPSGTFLAIALSYFYERGVAYFVIEGGRGVLSDEAGRLPSRVGVITSIFSEHSEYLGPTEADIANDKLSLSHHSDALVLGPTAAAWNEELQLIPSERIHQSRQISSNFAVPEWYLVDASLARTAVELLLGEECLPTFNPAVFNTSVSASFGYVTIAGRQCLYEGLISSVSIDREFYERYAAEHPKITAIVSLPDDKDITGVMDFFSRELLLPVLHVVIVGTRGNLSYDRTEQLFPDDILAHVGNMEPPALREAVESRKLGGQELLFLGTQSFIRLVKSAWDER